MEVKNTIQEQDKIQIKAQDKIQDNTQDHQRDATDMRDVSDMSDVATEALLLSQPSDEKFIGPLLEIAPKIFAFASEVQLIMGLYEGLIGGLGRDAKLFTRENIYSVIVQYIRYKLTPDEANMIVSTMKTGVMILDITAQINNILKELIASLDTKQKGIITIYSDEDTEDTSDEETEDTEDPSDEETEDTEGESSDHLEEHSTEGHSTECCCNPTKLNPTQQAAKHEVEASLGKRK